jgi:integrase
VERCPGAHVPRGDEGDEPLGALFGVVLLRGVRRGEAVGLRWADAYLGAGYVRVRPPIVLVRGVITESTPKTKNGDRLIWLDAETTRILKEHRTAQLRTRLEAGGGWQDNDLIFLQGRRHALQAGLRDAPFKRLSALAGLPVIKLHEGRHSAASLARDAEVDPEIRRRTLGYADAAMTSHYTHPGPAAYKAAAEAVAKLVEEAS